MMTPLLQKAVSELEKRPPDHQDTVAQLILDEIAEEAAWDMRFGRSQEKLGRLAEEARAEIARGEVYDYDPGSEPR